LSGSKTHLRIDPSHFTFSSLGVHSPNPLIANDFFWSIGICRRLIAGAFIVLALTSAPGAAQQTSAALAGPAYRIHPGDEIEIMVWGDVRLQRILRVLPDGTIAFPLAGHIVAGGQLPTDIERVITAALRPQYRGAVPQVTVMVKYPSGYQFSVIEKVQSPGTFTPGRT
jgi:polysaccharide export outer membrane protein